MTTNPQLRVETTKSAFLILGIPALQDISNFEAERFLPLQSISLIIDLGACFGLATGHAINLARDSGPRLMS